MRIPHPKRGEKGRAGTATALCFLLAASGLAPAFPGPAPELRGPGPVQDGSDPSPAQPAPGERLGVFFAGSGEPADTFDHVFAEIMAFLREQGVLVVNDPGDPRPFRMKPSSLEYFRENLGTLRADSLLFLHVEVRERKQDRMSLACFDASGGLVWEESLGGTLSMAFPKEVDSMVRQLKKRLKRHLVEPDLPLRHGKRTPADRP